MNNSGSLATTGHPGTLAKTSRSRARTARTSGAKRTAILGFGETHAIMRYKATDAAGSTRT